MNEERERCRKHLDSSESRKTLNPSTNSDAPQNNPEEGSWLWGFAGSEINFLLYCVVLYKLKKVVPISDYKEFRIVWWTFVSTICLTVLLVSLSRDEQFGILVAKGATIAISVPSFFLMQTADRNGFVIRKLFGGIGPTSIYRVLLGIVFSGSAAVYFLMKTYQGTWEAVLGMFCINFLTIFVGFLIRCIRLTNWGK